MLQQKQPHQLQSFLSQEFDSQNDEAKEENENTDPVDPMHITDPFIFWPVRIFLS